VLLRRLVWATLMQLNSRTGNQIKVLVARVICHVTVMATMTRISTLRLGGIDMPVLDLDHLKAGIDVVKLLRLAVAIVPCMVTIEVTPVVTMVVVTLAHLVEAEDRATPIADEAQMAIVGAQVPVNKGTAFLHLDPNG